MIKVIIQKYILLAAVFGILIGFPNSKVDAVYNAKQFNVTFTEWVGDGWPLIQHGNFSNGGVVVLLERRDGTFVRVPILGNTKLEERGWPWKGGSGGAKIVLKDEMKDIVQIQVTGMVNIEVYNPKYAGTLWVELEGASAVAENFGEDIIFKLRSVRNGRTANAKMILGFDSAGNLINIRFGTWTGDLKSLWKN